MQFSELKKRVLDANLALVKHGLVILTWGNASEIDRARGAIAIKPSGVDYASMTADDIVVVDLSGRVLEGSLRPSSDLPTHLALYRAFPNIGGVVHTHSPKATAWAQSGADLPAYGTTHADHFHGAVPCTRLLTETEVRDEYEKATGDVIAECFKTKNIDASAVPGVLVNGHGPFTWGANAASAVTNAVALEQIAAMAFDLRSAFGADVAPVPQYVLDKHYFRKHGPGAYYGQK